jgi:hypothetical protein
MAQSWLELAERVVGGAGTTLVSAETGTQETPASE